MLATRKPTEALLLAALTLQIDTTCPTCWSSNPWAGRPNTSLLKNSSKPRVKPRWINSLNVSESSKERKIPGSLWFKLRLLKRTLMTVKSPVPSLLSQKTSMPPLSTSSSNTMLQMMQLVVLKSKLWNNMFQNLQSSTRTQRSNSSICQ